MKARPASGTDRSRPSPAPAEARARSSPPRRTARSIDPRTACSIVLVRGPNRASSGRSRSQSRVRPERSCSPLAVPLRTPRAYVNPGVLSVVRTTRPSVVVVRGRAPGPTPSRFGVGSRTCRMSSGAARRHTPPSITVTDSSEGVRFSAAPRASSPTGLPLPPISQTPVFRLTDSRLLGTASTSFASRRGLNALAARRRRA
jgi:hypothetical protein